MRTESQMMELILSTAREDGRIRAVYCNGSRTNPNVPRDFFQDFDIVYVVTEIASFRADPHWIDRFGPVAVMQEPDSPIFDDPQTDPENRYAYLMQFEDGNRIDLSLQTIGFSFSAYLSDPLTLPLLDKDGILPQIPPPSDRAYWVKRPSQDQLRACANEFWWVSTYVAKGLWRREMLYALDHLNLYVRPQLICLLSWYAGCQTQFSVSVGKNGKYLDRYLPRREWDALLRTYPAANRAAVWDALFAACQLFSQVHPLVAQALGYPYDPQEGRRTTAYLHRVHALPDDARSFDDAEK